MVLPPVIIRSNYGRDSATYFCGTSVVRVCGPKATRFGIRGPARRTTTRRTAARTPRFAVVLARLTPGDSGRAAANMVLFRPPPATATVAAPVSTPRGASQRVLCQAVYDIQSARACFCSSSPCDFSSVFVDLRFNKAGLMYLAMLRALNGKRASPLRSH
eukprot:6208109-Pleurochrysis_carterae.AAC.1